MDTVLIEIKDDRAYQFLQGLEELNVIKLVNKNEEDLVTKESPTAKFRGALQLTEEEHNSLQQHIETIRNEWETGI